jgi:hypothetical protein
MAMGENLLGSLRLSFVGAVHSCINDFHHPPHYAFLEVVRLSALPVKASSIANWISLQTLKPHYATMSVEFAIHLAHATRTMSLEEYKW